MAGEVVVPGSPGYDAARKPAMARFHDVRPAAIVRCRTPADASLAGNWQEWAPYAPEDIDATLRLAVGSDAGLARAELIGSWEARPTPHSAWRLSSRARRSRPPRHGLAR